LGGKSRSGQKTKKRENMPFAAAEIRVDLQRDRGEVLRDIKGAS